MTIHTPAPLDRVVVSLSIDDVHPESAEVGSDCGGNRQDGAFGRLLVLLRKHPQLKVTLYVTPNWTYRPSEEGWKDAPFDLRKHPGWVRWLARAAEDGRIELAAHGYSHHREKWPFNEEFAELNEGESLRRLEHALEVFRNVELPITGGFRPPSWAITPELLAALKTARFRHIAASSDVVSDVVPACVSNQWGLKGVPLLAPALVADGGLLNIPTNWDPYWSDLDRANAILLHSGVLSIAGHIQDRYMSETLENGLSESVCNNLSKLFGYLEERYGSRLLYMTHEEIYSEFSKQPLNPKGSACSEAAKRS